MSSNKKTRPARRRSSFKLRITVWITLLIAVVSSLGIGGILITGSQIADSRLQNELISTVERNVDEIEYKNGILEIENDFAFFVDEVYCNVFDSSGRYIDGESPAALINSENRKNGVVGTFETDGNKYYYYDTRLDFNKYEYEIDASTGAIREKSVESRGKTRQDSASYIGVDRAKRIALIDDRWDIIRAEARSHRSRRASS